MVMLQVGGHRPGAPTDEGTPEMKVLFMSGYADSAIRGGDDPWPDAAFIQKPFAPAALAGKVPARFWKPATAEKRRRAGERPWTEMEQRLRRNGPFIQEILSTGRVVYQRP